jgi:hypothetical protein
MIRVPTYRPPTHPGEMLVEEFLTPMGIKESDLAEFIHVPPNALTKSSPIERALRPASPCVWQSILECHPTSG